MFYTTGWSIVNEGTRDLFRILVVSCILGLIPATTVFAVPPEGLEAFSMAGQGQQANFVYAQTGFVNPSWTSDYETFQSYVSWGTASGNYWTVGTELTVGNQIADRDIYFGRYDLVFWGQSVSLKMAHEDLRYLQAGKNIFSLDYNAGFNVVSSAAFFLSAGLYYRYNLNSWNTPTWNPLNFNTDDRDSFLEVCFGSKIILKDNLYFTVDLNNRDPFLSYNGDNFAFDFTFNLITSDSLQFRLTESTRISGLLVGTADFGEEKILLGVIISNSL